MSARRDSSPELAREGSATAFLERQQEVRLRLGALGSTRGMERAARLAAFEAAQDETDELQLG